MKIKKKISRWTGLFFSKWTGAKNRKMTEIATFYSKKKCRQIDRSFDGKQ